MANSRMDKTQEGCLSQDVHLAQAAGARSQYHSGDFTESYLIGGIRKGDVGLSAICVDKEVVL